jgi:hypothetical protein
MVVMDEADVGGGAVEIKRWSFRMLLYGALKNLLCFVSMPSAFRVSGSF